MPNTARKCEFKQVKKYCKFCGYKLVLHNTRDIKRKNFCSRSCRTKYMWKTGRINLEGTVHLKETRQKMSESKLKLVAKGWKPTKKRWKGPRTQISLNCAFCGKLFSTFRCRIFQIRQTPQKFCSKECRYKASRKPDWLKVDKTKLREWREKVLKKNDYKCVICGEDCKKLLQAHHIIYKSENINLAYAVNNGETLCIICHSKKHENEGLGGLFQCHLKRLKVV